MRLPLTNTDALALDSREFKVFLRADRPEGYRAFWELVKKTAAGIGTITENHKPFHERERTIIFLDTPDFALHQHGFVLRRRIRHDLGVPLPDYELTLKFRSPNPVAAAGVDILAAAQYRKKGKFEEDISFLKDTASGTHGISAHHHTGVKEMFSVDNSVVLSQKLPTTLKGCSEIFPILATLGLTPKTSISIVNNLIIDERTVAPGVFDPGRGAVGEITLSAWYEKATRKPLLAEFSCRREVKMHEHKDHAFRNFFTRVVEAGDAWAKSGTTKTAFVYGWKKKS